MNKFQKLIKNQDSVFSLNNIENLKSIKILYLNGERVNFLPESFGTLSKLEELYISFSHLKSLPESFGNLSNLKTLELHNTKLTHLPESFSNLLNLKTLRLCNNQLTLLPESFGNLITLKSLDLTFNPLCSLPTNFGNLKNLIMLKLERCELITLPHSFGNLSNLKHLNLENNSLQFLPESFGNLKKLSHLNLIGNDISYFPESFKNVKKFALFNKTFKYRDKYPLYLDLRGNPIRSLSNLPRLSLFNCLIDIKNLTSKGKELYNHCFNSNFANLPFDYFMKKLCKYYKKSPKELAHNYIKNPSSLTDEEKNRLIHEANHSNRKYLERFLHPEDPILLKIAEKLKIRLPNNFELL